MAFLPKEGLLQLGVIALMLAIVPFGISNGFVYGVVILAILNAAVAVSLNLFVGSAGQISLGHAAFFGIGAYAMAILPADHGLHGIAAALVGIAVVGCLAYFVGRPILRLKGHYLAMATLGVGIIVFLVINTEIAITGGPDGKPVLPMTVFGISLFGDGIWYAISAVFLLAVSWASLNILETGFGRTLRALHTSEAGAVSVGIDVAAAKVKVFVFSACVASAAGSIYAAYIGFVTPEEAGFMKSVGYVIMIVIGGLGSVMGAIVGAAIITVLPQLLTGFHDYEQLVFGVVLMLVVIGLRHGIVPTLHRQIRLRGAND